MKTVTFWNRPDLSPLRTFMDLFDENFGDSQGEHFSDQPLFHPACDVEETDSHLVINVDLPGVVKKDINIEVKDDRLFITGERKQEKKSRGSSERHYGKFHRVLALPTGLDIDKIEAQYQDGVLSVALPKAESVKPRQIKISEGKSGFFGKFIGSKKEDDEKSNSTANAA